MNLKDRIGIDLGGTKIEITALADDGAQLLRRRFKPGLGFGGILMRSFGARLNQRFDPRARDRCNGLGRLRFNNRRLRRRRWSRYRFCFCHWIGNHRFGCEWLAL